MPCRADLLVVTTLSLLLTLCSDFVFTGVGLFTVGRWLRCLERRDLAVTAFTLLFRQFTATMFSHFLQNTLLLGALCAHHLAGSSHGLPGPSYLSNVASWMSQSFTRYQLSWSLQFLMIASLQFLAVPMTASMKIVATQSVALSRYF